MHTLLRALLLAGAITLIGPPLGHSIDLAWPSPVAQAGGNGVGLHERRNRAQLRRWLGVDPARTRWCGAYVAARLRALGKPLPRNALAVSAWRHWGRSVQPRPGVVAVFRHSHVGIVAAVRPGCVLVTSGNDSNAIRTRCRRPSSIASYRWM